jgi:hypothetical protein
MMPDRDDFLDRLGDILVDSKTACFAWAFMTPSFITADRRRSYCHGNAQALDRICGEFQSASSAPWSLVSKSIQVHFVPGRSVFIGTGALYSLESLASRNC